MSVRRPRARTARPFLIGATAVAAIAALPSAAQAAPFSATLQHTCFYAIKGAPAGSPTSAFTVDFTYAGETNTLIEGGDLRLESGSLTLSGAGLSSLATLGDTVALSLTDAGVGTTGANRPLRPFVNRWGARVLGPITAGANTFTIPAGGPSTTGYTAPIVTGDDLELRATYRATGELKATTGGAETVYTFFCRVATNTSPPLGETIARFPVAPKAVPAPPTISGLEYRNSAFGGYVDIIGRFDGPVTSVDFGGKPAVDFRKVSYHTVRARIPSSAPTENVRVRVTTAAGETPDLPVDDFDFLGQPTVEQIATFDNTCVNSRRPLSEPVNVLTQLRAAIPTFARQGDPLSIDATATVLFPYTSLPGATNDSIGVYTAGLQNLRLGATGTSSTDVTLLPSALLSSGFPALGDGPSFAFDAPRASVSFGTVTGEPGSTVVLRPGSFTLSGQLSGSDPLDGMPLFGDYEYRCTPSSPVVPLPGAGDFAEIPIAEGSTPEPTVTPTPTVTPSPTATPTPTPTVTPTPTPVSDPLAYSYALAGSATLKTLTKGSLPLSGRLDLGQFALPSGGFNGDLTLAPTTGNLTALGFLPVQAKVNLVPTEKVAGSLKGGKLTAVAKVRIKLPSVKALGIELAGGANCQAKQISSITLGSTQTTFLPLSGGPLAGTFDISDLSGCGFLTGIVSPLTKGSGNAIALNLTSIKP